LKSLQYIAKRIREEDVELCMVLPPVRADWKQIEYREWITREITWVTREAEGWAYDVERGTQQNTVTPEHQNTSAVNTTQTGNRKKEGRKKSTQINRLGRRIQQKHNTNGGKEETGCSRMGGKIGR
jgi:hypothetical protein